MMYEYHHLGIPTNQSHPDERYVTEFKMYTWGYETSEFHIQWHRYDKDCPLHPLIKTVPHVTFKVPNLKETLEGKNLILEPYFS